ncbi:MAG: hypothetical protein EOO78_13485, partial [Oxalobacteraceae bacterium]
MRVPAHGVVGPGGAGAVQAARLGWSILAGICGGLAVAAPCWLHGVPAGAGWSVLGLLTGALYGASGHRHLHALACMAALAFGMSIDFARVPPFALLAWCGAASGLADMLFLAHLRWFPVTTLAMLALMWPGAATPRACLGAALRFAGMLAAMSLAAQGVRALAPLAGMAWSAGAMTGAMLAGMLLFLHAWPSARAGGAG